METWIQNRKYQYIYIFLKATKKKGIKYICKNSILANKSVYSILDCSYVIQLNKSTFFEVT